MAKRFPRVGELRQRVTIQTRSDEESGTYSLESVREDVATVSAKIENVSGVQQVDSRNANAGITHRIWIRYRADVTVKNELLYHSKRGTYRYTIETIQDTGDERNRFLLLDCNQEAEQDTLDNPSPEVS